MATTEQRDEPTFIGQLLDELWLFSPPTGELPDATPAEGPDPYGNPAPDWMRIDWHQHLHRVELEMAGAEPAPPNELARFDHSNRTIVNYAEMGEGSVTLLFVHGLSGSWQNWLEQIPHFARDYRVIALDLPGFGHSPAPPWKISIEEYGRVLHEFCKAVGVGDCVVIGNSMGGFISAEAVSREPDRFQKLALVSAAGVSSARMRRQPAETAARMSAAALPLLLRAQARGFRRPRLRWLTFKGIFDRPEELRSELLAEQFYNGAGRPSFLPALQALIGYDILDELEEVEVPTLIVWGRNDRVVPSNDAFGYAERLRNSRVFIFDQCGHCPQLERPVRFNRVLETFLTE
jgi:pimeloyl-ACP methyl ester carboxylesterase